MDFNNAKELFTKQEMFEFASKNLSIEGLICEFGCQKGNSINCFAKNLPNKTIHGFDSFEGLPEKWFGPYRKGIFKVNHKKVHFEENVKLHVGLFSDTIPVFKKENEGLLSFVHVDCDLYSSTKDVFNGLKDRFVKGTLILFDEYHNYPTWEEHEYKAFMEFIEETGFAFEYLAYKDSEYGQALVVLK